MRGLWITTFEEGNKMKWFKHHSDMSMNDKIGKLEAKYGLVGYAVYLKILEMCALNWDEVSDPVFSFSSKQIKNKLRLKSKQTDFILGLMSDLNLFQISKYEDEVIIKAPKLAEIKKRYEKKHAEDTRQPRGNPTPNKKGDNKKGEGDKKGASFDLEFIYQAYPRKEGKKIGLERLEKIITSQEIYDQVLLAVNNYAKIKQGEDLKFIKQFSSFVSNWTDYLEIQLSEQEKSIANIERIQQEALDKHLAELAAQGVANA